MGNESIKVAVHGALGKMGKAVVEAVSKDDSTVLIAGIDKFVGKTGNFDVFNTINLFFFFSYLIYMVKIN